MNTQIDFIDTTKDDLNKSLRSIRARINILLEVREVDTNFLLDDIKSIESHCRKIKKLLK